MAYNKYIEPFLYLDKSKCQTMEFLHRVYFDLDYTAYLSHAQTCCLRLVTENGMVAVKSFWL